LRPVRLADVDLREIGARPGETKRPPRPWPLRRRAIEAAEAWVKDRQEADGSWGGIQPPWVWSIIMMAALGRGFEDETRRRLRELGMGDEAVRRGLDWIAGMQSADGGWGAFDADNSSYWLHMLPFCDFGYVIDPPSEDVSAQALEAFGPVPGYEDVLGP